MGHPHLQGKAKQEWREARLNPFVFAIELWSKALDGRRFRQAGLQRIGAFLNYTQVEIRDGDVDPAMDFSGVFNQGTTIVWKVDASLVLIVAEFEGAASFAYIK